ncbi:hypothetical protein OROMI_006432 [Orobanche minor]
MSSDTHFSSWVPPVKPLDSPQTYDDFFTLTFKSHGVKILGLYVARDQYLFASKVLDSGAPHPFEKVQGVDFWLPCSDVKEVDLDVSYRSLQVEQKAEEIERLIIPAADTKAPKPFSVRMTPRNVHYSSDSDSSDSESYSESNSDTEGDSQGQKMIVPRIEADTKAPKPFSARMTFRNIHYSSDSDSSYSSYSSDSDSDSDSEAIAQVESELQEENSPKDTAKELEFQHNAAPEEDKTPFFNLRNFTWY